MKSTTTNQYYYQGTKLWNAGAHLKILCLAEGGGKFFFGISCEKITILCQFFFFFPILGGGPPPPPGSAPGMVHNCVTYSNNIKRNDDNYLVNSIYHLETIRFVPHKLINESPTTGTRHSLQELKNTSFKKSFLQWLNIQIP